MGFWTGIIGSLVLVAGAAWPDRPVKNARLSAKNWLFAVGGVLMLLYAVIGWQNGGALFFVILELLVVFATVLMMTNTPDRFDEIVLPLVTLGMIVWALAMFEGYATVVFILGLCGVGLGYALDAGSVRREAALTAGSALIALFSYLEASWIFFWLNFFFALFSVWYLTKALRTSKRR